MQRAQIVIPGIPGTVLARVAPALSEWLGPAGCVLGGGTVLAARWQHRVSTDVPTESTAEILARKVQSRILDLGAFTARDLYDIVVAQDRDRKALRRVMASITAQERTAIASELRGLPRGWTGDQPVREPARPELLTELPRRARALFEAVAP
ncbi:MAG: hypothetical protein OXH15_12265 [Gammaproteobacteria bacterium]|nr:hypothetical protein [Gammaproteobacteria bacterium]